jgi:hypothetical protein
VFDHMEAESFQQENTEMMSFYAWMANPELLHRSKTVTFFMDRDGHSSTSDGPSPSVGAEVDLLIHLVHYNNWTPQPTRLPSSDVSGVPASSSDSSPGRTFPFFKSFSWIPGVLYGHAPARQAEPRMLRDCHKLSAQRHRNVDPEEEGQERHGWRCNINARGRPIGDLPRRSSQGARERMRSPRGRYSHRHGDRYGEAEDSTVEGRGRWILRSSMLHRFHQPQRRDDEGRDHRRSMSPVHDHVVGRDPLWLQFYRP